MCRVLSYLGKPILAEELLYKPDNSFIKQSYHPKHMSYLLNLAGFGIVAWDNYSYNPNKPYIYKTSRLPFYDENIRNLAEKIKPYCLLTHIRGVAYSEKRTVSNQNVHPFIFDGTNIALAHNGALAEFDTMKYDLLEYIHPNFQKRIRGSTDSEWIYAVFLSQLASFDEIKIEDIAHAVEQTFKILHKVRHKHNIAITSPVNIFFTNGKFIAATRYVLDYGWHSPDKDFSAHNEYHSLWYTYGESYGYYDGEYKMKGKEKTSIIIASEPLTEDTTTWIEVPEYSLLIAYYKDNEIEIFTKDIML